MPFIDEVNLSELDFIDVGEVVAGEGFVPVVVKSLAFGM
ncbi:MAG: ethanolamine ammonia-lyase reactivating factor EutA [Candidatus Binatia bacterium]